MLGSIRYSPIRHTPGIHVGSPSVIVPTILRDHCLACFGWLRRPKMQDRDSSTATQINPNGIEMMIDVISMYSYFSYDTCSLNPCM